MTDAATISWILYSLELASASGPADSRAISQVADGLNHAVPTHKELQSSLRWLADAGLIESESQRYSLSAAGTGFMARGGDATARQVLHQLTDRIASRIELSPNTSLERTRDG